MIVVTLEMSRTKANLKRLFKSPTFVQIRHPTPNFVHMYKSAKCNVDYLGVLKTGRAAESIT